MDFKCQHTHMVWRVYDEWNALMGLATETKWAGVARCTRLGYHRGQHKDASGQRWY